MKYSEILQDVLAGKFVRQCKTCRWIILKESGMWDDGPHNPDFVLEKRDYAIDTWEVKQDPEEIFVWGRSLTIDGKEESIISLSSDFPIDNVAFCEKADLFPSAKPQKYKLVPVEEEKIRINRDKEHYRKGRQDILGEINESLTNLGYANVVVYLNENFKES